MTSSSPPGPARARLAQLLDDRRLELGLTWDEVAKRAGIHRETLRQIRQGKSVLRPLTRRGLEEALQWRAGSIQAVLDGGAPETVTQEGASEPSPAPAADPATRARILMRKAQEYIAEAQQILGEQPPESTHPGQKAG